MEQAEYRKEEDLYRKGKKNEMATWRFPGSLSSGTSRRTVAQADERNKETRGKESTVGGMAKTFRL